METSTQVLYNILCDRLTLLRQLDSEEDSDRKRHIARETSELHAKLAHRLGLYAIKTEMEDLSLKFLHYDIYKDIARALNEKKSERDAYIADFIAPLKRKLEAQGFVFTIKGRPKSIHSIYQKMLAQHCGIDHIYDLFAIRIILDSKPADEKSDCWKVYSLITDIFPPNPKRLRDWISVPKSNGYESLHTTVKGPQDKWVEIQIRTKRMDDVAENGVASHWAYKGIDPKQISIEDESIFVFTPMGDLKKLSVGATVLDFAFSIHSKLGCTCTGGKVNGVNVPIRQELHNGDQIEVKTSPNQKPTSDWLNYVVSSRAKSKIRQALKGDEYKAADEGREVLARRLKNWKLDFDDKIITHISLTLGYKTLSDFYQSLAEGKEELLHLKDMYVEALNNLHPTTHVSHATPPPTFVPQPTGLQLEVDFAKQNIDYSLAKCCNPQQDDDILGFITINKGITIHKASCPNIQHLKERFPYRIITSKWKSN